MSYNRKDFLKVLVGGGLGLCFGGADAVPKFFRDRGARLTAVSRQSLLMGSVARFEVIAETEKAGYEAINRAVKVFQSVDKRFSMYRPDSEMSALSRAAGTGPVQISNEAHELLSFARNVYSATGGLFDVTIEPAMQLWGFRNEGKANIEKPDSEELRHLERIIGMEKLELESDRAFLREKGMAIDSGGIAGGYALDKAIEAIKVCDISAAFINFSGDIHCFGTPLTDDSWKVHLLDPQTREPVGKAHTLDNRALSTSGAYQNRRQGRKDSWGHLLHPATGEPIEPVGSVTAIHASAMMADAWSTATYIGATAPEDVETIII